MPPFSFPKEIWSWASAPFRQIRSRPSAWLSDWLSTQHRKPTSVNRGRLSHLSAVRGRSWRRFPTSVAPRCTAASTNRRAAEAALLPFGLRSSQAPAFAFSFGVTEYP